MSQKISLIIADDHEIFRDGLALMLGRQDDFLLLAQARDGRELIDLVAQTPPDIVITDIKMPKLDGILATRELLQKWPDIKIIALSMFDEDHLIVEMLEAGAKGYLLKNADKKEILESIFAVYEGSIFYCKHTSARLAGMIVRSQVATRQNKQAISFSDREQEIIKLICKQLTAQQIGAQLFLSKRTVEGYRTKIMEKIDARNTAGVVIFALKHNLIKEDDIR